MPSSPTVSAHLFQDGPGRWWTLCPPGPNRKCLPGHCQCISCTSGHAIRTTAGVLGFVESVLGNGMQCGLAHHGSSIYTLWTAPSPSVVFAMVTVVVACQVTFFPIAFLVVSLVLYARGLQARGTVCSLCQSKDA